MSAVYRVLAARTRIGRLLIAVVGLRLRGVGDIIGHVQSPNEAYNVIPSPARLRMPAGWLTVTCNGIPVRHFGPASKHLAERYATDPEYRQSRVIRKVHEDAGRQ